MAEHKLTELQKRFGDEYLVDLNATAAYRRAGYKGKGNVAEVNASRLLSNAKVQEYIQTRQKAREKRTEITQDMVLQRWWAIANADPNELIYHRRVCCRHCFGVDHAFQWIDEEEYKRAVESARFVAKQNKQKPVIPLNIGGYGFDPTIRPHPKCPACYGEGHGDVKVMDTRDLTPEVRMLYAGVKVSKEGIEVKMRDQDKALENVARHLGMFKDRLELEGGITVKKLEDLL
ncbi:terminase small subunit [Paenibacillus koleovorans]|uniref:terminase small subunit n=1 Tax=Paenibacillus koleovorans TaxID=121608 RepID=UPI000FD84BB0|nr:terminase small subunit [Paenibacillus koleovorans]